MRTFWLSFALLFAVSACADTTVSTDALRDEPLVTVQQPVVDANAPNWFVAGGGGYVEMVGGTDGEPDELTGRFALQGQEIFHAESGSDRWIVVGAGQTQPLDDEAQRLRETREVLDSQSVEFIEPAPTGWLIGGGEGRLQLLDAEGEPTATTVQVLDQSTVNAAAFNGSSWLVGAENGNVVAVNQALSLPGSPSGQTADGGEPIVAILAEPTDSELYDDPPWLAFSTDSAIPVSGTGVPGTPVLIESGLQITTAKFVAGKIFIGTADGRIAGATYGPSPDFTFTNVLNGAEVTRILHDGTEWLALGANGQAQRFDNNGNVLGEPVQISQRGRPLVGAHAVDDGWLIVVGEIGFVAFVDKTLASPRDLAAVLGGADILTASAGEQQVLVAGADGNYQILDDTGATVGTPALLAGAGDLHAASWNGDAWLVAGDGGFVQLIDAGGAPVGSSSTLLGGNTIRFASWSGEFWLVGGDDGQFQLVRADGTASGSPRTLDGAETLYDARWNTSQWLMVGVTPTDTGIYALTVADQAAEPTPAELPNTGALRAVDFNGIEWLVAGDFGLIQRVSAQGMPVETAVDVLNAFQINDIYYNGTNYIVAGEFGAIRRLGQNYLPLRTAISVLDREAANVVVWTLPRGFPTGPCITNEMCYEAVCVGGLGPGKCCDAICDRPCESCFQGDTGEPDGTCAPVVAGKTPPSKANGSGVGCMRQSEATCGLTGLCDGAGECEFYGEEVICAESVCSLGQFTPQAACSGGGACSEVQEIDCAPYAGCNESGCVSSCNSDQDCVAGFVCAEGDCVEETETMEPDPMDDTPPPEDDGCCATTRAEPQAHWWLIAVVLMLGVRRSRR